MKRLLLVLAGLAVGALLLIAGFSGTGRAQQKGYAEHPYLPKKPENPFLRGLTDRHDEYLNKLLNREKKAWRPVVLNTPEPNRDILVSPKIGEWMVLICSYSGEKRDLWARQMVALLRGNDYRLPAYVYNYGRREMIEEEKRILEYIKQQRARYEKLRSQLKRVDQLQKVKLNIRRIPIKMEAGVLVGGYRDRAAAKRARDEIRKMKAPDHTKVALDRMFVAQKTKKSKKENWIWVNPLRQAFVVRNPTATKQKKKPLQLDVKVLRHLNSEEKYSLFKCKKKITMAIREFRIPTKIVEKGKTAKTFGGIFTRPAAKTGGGAEWAAHNAHNLAKILRHMRPKPFEAYVLHTKLSSVVTVGGFDSVRDPRFRLMQQRLDRLKNSDPAWTRSAKGAGLFPKGLPMMVPR